MLVNDIDARLGEKVTAAISAAGGKASFFRADVTKSADMKALVQAAVERHGRLDVVVGDAGVVAYGRIEDVPVEVFDAVLATNLRSNIDEAFTRRLDAIVDFPAPTADLRRSLWERCLAPPLPVADDVDLDFLAAAFELAGGNILRALRGAEATARSMKGVAPSMATLETPAPRR